MALNQGKNGSKAVQAEIDANRGKVVSGSYTVAQLPAASAANAGEIRYCSNGAAGQPCLVYSNGTAWKVVALGATASAT